MRPPLHHTMLSATFPPHLFASNKSQHHDRNKRFPTSLTRSKCLVFDTFEDLQLILLPYSYHDGCDAGITTNHSSISSPSILLGMKRQGARMRERIIRTRGRPGVHQRSMLLKARSAAMPPRTLMPIIGKRKHLPPRQPSSGASNVPEGGSQVVCEYSVLISTSRFDADRRLGNYARPQWTEDVGGLRWKYWVGGGGGLRGELGSDVRLGVKYFSHILFFFVKFSFSVVWSY
jgi:hypothetical protein